MGTAGCCGNPRPERRESHVPLPLPPLPPHTHTVCEKVDTGLLSGAVQLLFQLMLSGKEIRLMRLLGTDQY